MHSLVHDLLTGAPLDERFLTEAQCVALAESLFRFGASSVRIESHWGGTVRWGRNRVTLASDRREVRIGFGNIKTNQSDPAALEAAVRAAQRLYAAWPWPGGPALGVNVGDPRYVPEYPKVAVWGETTYQLPTEVRGRVVHELIAPAEAQGMLAAGYLAAEAKAIAIISTWGRRLYGRETQARCATTVRDPQGTGSGWAGKTNYDWGKIDAPALGARALRKCLESRNPVALEPGRYTVILEPQAVADLLGMLINPLILDRMNNEASGGSAPFWLRPQYSKLGLKVADERVTIGQDPLDPELGSLPFAGNREPGDPYRQVNWIEKGVLTALAYNRGYATTVLPENLGLIARGTFRMAGGETPIDEMIATTKRGLLVTRFSGVQLLDDTSVLSVGLTRDGLWLIENGKITKPVKNFRFAESPLFALNKLEQLGPAEAVFRPGLVESSGPLLQPAVVPPLKVRDFNFTALVDAV